MKAEPILAETYRIKEMLATNADYSLQRLCDRIENSTALHGSLANQVHSADELALIVAREAPVRLAAIPPKCLEPYRMRNPIIAEIHGIRERLSREHAASDLVLKDEPPRNL